jgi:hypothetical protein
MSPGGNMLQQAELKEELSKLRALTEALRGYL